MRESLLSDFLITGTNAITEDGYIMQMDSGGNRVAGIAYGPKNVIVLSGINKIVKNIDEGYERLYYSGILNAKRLNHKTPCNFVSVVKSGKRPLGNIN